MDNIYKPPTESNADPPETDGGLFDRLLNKSNSSSTAGGTLVADGKLWAPFGAGLAGIGSHGDDPVANDWGATVDGTGSNVLTAEIVTQKQF
jgi:hypothetical protein